MGPRRSSIVSVSASAQGLLELFVRDEVSATVVCDLVNPGMLGPVADSD
jgi:hypothetical protein